jgi:hypothetical protein
MTDIDVHANSVTPEGFRLEPTYEHLVAETGYDPELGATESQPVSGTAVTAGVEPVRQDR